MLSDWRAGLIDYIREQAKPVEKYGHQPRLYELTRQIGAGLTYEDDVVFAAVWLHDLGVFTGHRPEEVESLKRWDNTVYAIEYAPGLLVQFGFPEPKIPAVLDCLRHHQPTGQPTTIEATILRDADILEQLGAIGILRTVCKVGRDTRFHTFTDAVANLRNALDRLPGMIRLDTAKELAKERVRAMAEFLNAVSGEAGKHLH